MYTREIRKDKGVGLFYLAMDLRDPIRVSAPLAVYYRQSFKKYEV